MLYQSNTHECAAFAWWTACVRSKLVNDMIPNKCPMTTHELHVHDKHFWYIHTQTHATCMLKDEMKQQISLVINQIVLHKICIQITFLRSVKKVMGKCLVILIRERHHYHALQSDMSVKCLLEMIFMQNINKNNKSSHKTLFSKYLFWHRCNSLHLANEWNMCISEKLCYSSYVG